MQPPQKRSSSRAVLFRHALSLAFVRALILLLALAPAALAQDPDPVEFFEKNVRPILAENCQVCHSAQLKTAELDLSTAAGFLRGGASGPLVSQDDPAESRLLKVISYEDRMKMPPMGKLSGEQIAAVTTWVNMGAPWPGAEQVAAIQPQKKSAGFTEDEKSFWAFQPMRDPAPPVVADQTLIRSPIDRFIVAKLEQKGLSAAPPAAKLTLLRRASFDLTGLPPTEKEIAEFLADDSPKAFEKVIDRLLASPRYGERWGRHWLDVARYADSTGNDEDHRYPYAWRYRDYVIDAFNSDLPYDQFVREQVAGDLLPTDHPDGINRRGIVATGFLALGPKAIAQQDKTKMLNDVYDEQIDVLSKAFLGLTLSCARCHDHKFDPLRTKDYYSMVGIFASSKNFEDPQSHVSKLLFTPLVPDQIYQQYLAEQDRLLDKQFEINNIVDAELKRYIDGLSPRLSEYMLAAHQVSADGAPIAQVAARHNLEEHLLNKWVAYLGSAQEPRPHLAEWRAATATSRSQVAEVYQQRFSERLAEWQEKLAKWREVYQRMLKEKNMPPPPRPQFDPESDPFFHEVLFADAGPFALSEEEREQVFSADSRAQLAVLRQELAQLEQIAMPEPDMACAIQEGEIVEQRVFIRGDYGSPGEIAPKAFPAILGGDNGPPVTQGSGRLELANWLTEPSHPLTARVMVNRIWQWHFGEGIVRTPSNFGLTGERPTHPELLDYLARRFVESGWSIKQMHRLIMLSDAYQRGSEISPKNAEYDPQNQLLSRFNRRRLDVEEIRDGLLAIDGSLDKTMGGALMTGFGTDGENSNKRLSADPEKVRRRMIYLPLRRANLPTLLNLFDFGDAVTSLDKRPQTNVAPQALFMMNSEFVAEHARNVAQALLDQPGLSDGERLERAYLRTVNRRPDGSEIDAALTYLDDFKHKFEDSISELDAWQSFCRILLASNEFIYVD